MLLLPGCVQTISLPGMLRSPRGAQPGLPCGPRQTAPMPPLPPLTARRGARAAPAPLQRAPVGVAPGTVARWRSLGRSHPSPRALLAPHHSGIRPQRAPCSARAVRLGTGSAFLPGCRPPPPSAEVSQGILPTTAITPLPGFPCSKP